MANKFYTAQGEVKPDAVDPKAPVPVWDPDTNSMRGVDRNTAAQLAQEGYEIGPEALSHGIRQSAEYKAAGALASFGEAGSMGLSDLASVALGNEQGVREHKSFEQDHPYLSGAASFLGYGANYGFGAGQVGLGLAGKLGTTTARSALAHVILPGAVASAVEGVNRELTNEALMRDPVNLDQIAASMFTNVLVNSIGNTLGYGVGKTLPFLRSKVGDWADWFEKVGLHPQKLKRVQNIETEPRVSRATFSGEQPIDDTLTSTLNNGADDAIEKAQVDQVTQAPIVRETNATARQAGKDQAAAATEGAAKADVVPQDAVADDIEPVFAWPKGYTKQNKTSVLTRMMKHVVGQDATNLQIWNESTAVGKEIGKYRDAVKRGDLDEAKVAPLVDDLLRKKEEYKDYLRKYVKGSIEGDTYRPGFADLDAEYARVSGNQYYDLKDPVVTLPRAETNVEGVKGAASGAAFPKADTAAKKAKPGKARYSVSFTFPKKPPEYAVVGIKQPFSTTTIASTLTAGALVPGLGLPSKAIAGYMGTRNTLAFLANHRGPIGNAVGNIGDKLFQYGTPTVRAAVKTMGERAQHKAYQGIGDIDVSDYPKAVNILGHAATNPQLIESYIRETHPRLSEEHPQAAAQIATTIMRAARMLNDTVPKRPYSPTLRNTEFRPPRAQQYRMLSRWQILSNPDMALHTGDPQTLQLLKEIYPAWYAEHTKRLMNETQSFRGDVDGQVARNITAFTGAPVNPINNAAALKRLHATASPMPPDTGQQGQASPKVGGGPQSTKTANAAANRDDPSFELN